MKIFRGIRYAFYFVKCVVVGTVAGEVLVQVGRWWK